jgi:hypothetical protein
MQDKKMVKVNFRIFCDTTIDDKDRAKLYYKLMFYQKAPQPMAKMVQTLEKMAIWRRLIGYVLPM